MLVVCSYCTSQVLGVKPWQPFEQHEVKNGHRCEHRVKLDTHHSINVKIITAGLDLF